MKPRQWLWLAGAALILVSNAVAWLGVAYNRSGEPESRVVLGPREWRRVSAPGGASDRNDLVLSLHWRVADTVNRDDDDEAYELSGGLGHAAHVTWLDEPHLTALGFDVALLMRRGQQGAPGFEPARHVIVVLELDGPARQAALEKVRRAHALATARLRALPADKALVTAVQHAEGWLAREELENSRLFAIDAGNDGIALRAKYPDRSRYLLLEGEVRASVEKHRGQVRVRGRLMSLLVPQITVPRKWRQALEDPAAAARFGLREDFSLVMAVGRRFEPWIESVASPKPPTPASP